MKKKGKKERKKGVNINLRFYCLVYIIITVDKLWQNYR